MIGKQQVGAATDAEIYTGSIETFAFAAEIGGERGFLGAQGYAGRAQPDRSYEHNTKRSALDHVAVRTFWPPPS